MNQTEAKRRQAEAVANILTLITIYILGRLVGDNGITYMAVAAEVCALLWTALSGSLSDALGKMLRSRRNKGQYKNAAKLRTAAMLFHGVLGLAGSLVLFLLAGQIAEGLFRVSYSALILTALAPIVLLRTVSAVLTGYFQGEGSELPRAASGILRQVLILGFGLLFCNIAKGYGEKVSSLLRQDNFTAMYGGVGIAAAVCLAELFVILFLFVILKGNRRAETGAKQESMYSTDTVWDCVRYLYYGRWPQFATGFLLFLPLPLGMILLGRKAPDETAAALEYGAYAGRYLVVCGIAAALIFLMAVPVIVKVFQCFKRREGRLARNVFQSGVHICMVHGIYVSVFAAVMGSQAAGILCPENAELTERMLQGGSSVILCGALSFYFGRMLHATGKRYLVLLAVCAADIIFFAVTILSIGQAGILSLIYGGVAGLFIFCILLGLFCYRQFRMSADWLGVVVVPLGAGAVTGLVCMLLGKAFTPHLGNLVTLIVEFVFSGALYWVILLLLRNFKEQELENIPGGRLIGALGQILRVY